MPAQAADCCRQNPAPPLRPAACNAAWRLAGPLLCLLLAACMPLQPYRTRLPEAPPPDCGAPGSGFARPDAPCGQQATEHGPHHTLHYVEFDDQGWAYDDTAALRGRSQTDSAVAQILARMADPQDCVRLFVYVHGWRHNARADDGDVREFRSFLAEVGQRSAVTAREARTATAARNDGAGVDPCDDPAVAGIAAARRGQSAARTPPARVHTVGLYVGWRGGSLVDVPPWVHLSFWDRKHAAERVAQGSVRELLGRLSRLKASAAPAGARARLNTYVIGHSFGASVLFRALSQSLIDSFAEDLDTDCTAPAAVSRYLDMVVLVNPAIEAARLHPVYQAARKQQRRCPAPGGGPAAAPYQAPVLAVLTSEADWATRWAFPLGSHLGNLFERVEPDQADAQQRAMNHTMGWDARYRTHRLALAKTCAPDEATPFDPASDPLRYRPPGWRWCFPVQQERMVLQHLLAPGDGRPPAYNGPLWNVQLSSEISGGHSENWTPRLRALLLHLFTDEHRHSLSTGP